MLRYLRMAAWRGCASQFAPTSFKAIKSWWKRRWPSCTTTNGCLRPRPAPTAWPLSCSIWSATCARACTDFLSSDGEKPNRNRDGEFAEPHSLDNVRLLQAEWAAAWPILFELLNTLKPADLLRIVTIRGEAHTVLAALQRQATHYAYHSGQVVQLAKIIRGESFKSLSIPRGQSEQFN